MRLVCRNRSGGRSTNLVPRSPYMVGELGWKERRVKVGRGLLLWGCELNSLVAFSLAGAPRPVASFGMIN